MKPDIDAVKFLLGESTSRPGNNTLRENLQSSQEIAISKGDQDSGLFELNFYDERYLPFEGTGAISDWLLSLPKTTNRFDTSTIPDVIIHIDYTSFSDIGLSKKVKDLLKSEYHGILTVNLSSVYPKAWQRFKQTKAKLVLKSLINIFPTYVKEPKLDNDKGIYVVPRTSNADKLDVTLNGYTWDNKTYKMINNSSLIDHLKIEDEWIIELKGIDPSEVEEVAIIIPYHGQINGVKSIK